MSEPLTIMDLRPEHCRWPLTTGAGAIYCGEPRLAPHSYCPAHCGRAFRLDEMGRAGRKIRRAMARGAQ